MNQRSNYTYVHPSLPVAICEALARGGQCEAAKALIEYMIEVYVGLGARGLPFGMCHETAARVAILMENAARFTYHARLCAHEYRVGRNSILKAKYGRLLQEAEEHGRPTPTDLPVGEPLRPSNTTAAVRVPVPQV